VADNSGWRASCCASACFGGSQLSQVQVRLVSATFIIGTSSGAAKAQVTKGDVLRAVVVRHQEFRARMRNIRFDENDRGGSSIPEKPRGTPHLRTVAASCASELHEDSVSLAQEVLSHAPAAQTAAPPRKP